MNISLSFESSRSSELDSGAVAFEKDAFDVCDRNTFTTLRLLKRSLDVYCRSVFTHWAANSSAFRNTCE